MARLTRTQLRMLDLLNAKPRRWWTGAELAAAMYDHFRHAAGAHQTAASLVRRGLIYKQTTAGKVTYAIAPRGTENVRAARSLGEI
jgi:hypothetical protein